jgi:dTDP-4-dehydrorhamnose reductase
LKVSNILLIAAEDYPTKAKRPRNSRLALDRLAGLFGVTTPPWEKALDRELDELTRQGLW